MDKYFLKSLSCTFDSRLLYEISVQISTSKWCQWIEIYVYHVSVTNSISMCIFRHYKWSGNVSFCFLDFFVCWTRIPFDIFVILFSLRGFENAQVQTFKYSWIFFYVSWPYRISWTCGEFQLPFIPVLGMFIISAALIQCSFK